MKIIVACLMALVGCVVDVGSDETGADVAAVGTGPCPAWMCGTNSPVIDGLGFHELNLDGVDDSDGFRLGNVVINGTGTYRLTVADGELGFIDASGQPFVGPPPVGTQIQVFHLANGVTTEYRLQIEQVNPHTPFWALAPGTNGGGFTSYVFQWKNPAKGGDWIDLCSYTGAPDLDQYYATVFEGERIDAASKRVVGFDPRWVNFGCAGSTLAKLMLTGHTQAAANKHGFSTTLAQRQTMVKMLSADYCGTGTPFTVAGQPLNWLDDQGTMHLPLITQEALEAEWTPSGATCINHPRVYANPTPLGTQTFDPSGVVTEAMFVKQIQNECISHGRAPLPICSAPVSSVHLASYNPGGIVIWLP